MDDKMLLDAIRSIVQEETEPINDRLDGLEAGQQRLETRLDKLETKVDKLETKVDKGFANLEHVINTAAADAAKTEKRLREHEEKPHIA